MQRIRELVPGGTVVAPPEERLAAELSDAEIFYGWYSPEIFRAARKLRWIQFTGAGLDGMLPDELVARGLLITNASGAHAPQVAEMAWALTLAIARGLPTYLRHQREHRWEWAERFDLDGATAGIVGMGGVGRRYARTALAFGMRVVAVDIEPVAEPEGVEGVWGLERLDDLIEVADVLLIACPYTSATRRLIGEPRFARMKRNAILVNVSRGGIVDEGALADALRGGCLAGAGIDVCETEPLPAESPLWDVPNLIITPHCAGLSAQRGKRLADLFCENLRRYRAGEALLNVVDQRKGYPISIEPAGS
jgi:D-3-phosphoglycerate dehydrogenase